jgi:hypothetical protein
MRRVEIKSLIAAGGFASAMLLVGAAPHSLQGPVTVDRSARQATPADSPRLAPLRASPQRAVP